MALRTFACIVLLGCGAPARIVVAERAAGIEAPSHVPPGLRLPGQVEPTAYRLRLRVDPAEPTFTGTVEIDVRVLSPSSAIWLHAHGLDVDAATAAVGGRTIELSPRRRDEDVIGLHAPRPIEGAATLTLTYRGRQDERSTIGLFRQRVGEDWYSFTQLEPVFARRVFPAIDEPARTDRASRGSPRGTRARGGLARTGAPRWEVPFCWAYDHEGRRREMCAVLQKKRSVIVLDTTSCPRWLPSARRGASRGRGR